jgi:O-methyltransferase involved in polyketide biosynthesis
METNSTDRNYNTISPSAKSLLLLKGLTAIPFARQAAELLMHPLKYIPDFTNTDFLFWARVVHFENRYWSIDQLLPDLSIQNILELSSGFSFRGLEVTRREAIHYIDTDLPEIIAQKKEFLAALDGGDLNRKGKLETLPLNALDEKQFAETINHFPDGQIVIVNEGLLMYLNPEEKEKLCAIIHKTLKQRGGYWITADIYIKGGPDRKSLKIDDKSNQFFEQHRIEDNKFDSMASAKEFFRKAGFIIDQEAVPDYTKLCSLNYMLKNAGPEQSERLKKAGKIHATWRLKIIDG